MMQTDLQCVQASTIARSLLRDMGLEVARAYALDKRRNASVPYRKMWSEVVDNLSIQAHCLPFRPDLVPWILEGRKTATTRRRKKLDVGDVFYVMDRHGIDHGFKVIAVQEGTARDLISKFWEAEGYACPLDMAYDLGRIYPDSSLDAPMTTHVFEAIA